MSMASALSNVFSLQRARYESERVATGQNERDDDDHNSLTLANNLEDVEQGITVSAATQQQQQSTSRLSTMATANNGDHRNSTEANEDDDDDSVPDLIPPSDDEDERLFGANNNDDSAAGGDASVRHQQSRPTISLEELQEERELARRRSSACLMLAVFVLFRLWIEALWTSDFGLLLLCLVGTSWTARWIRYHREREEELDRRIANYANEGNNMNMDRQELRMMSFQAQLALAILDSQRMAMQGGYGRDDNEATTPGVSEQAKARWQRFAYQDDDTKSYGSVQNKADMKSNGDDVPHCSICLGEYESGEDLVKLPCRHVYHEECIDSWTTNHQRCPLCNTDLEGGASDATTANMVTGIEVAPNIV